MKYVYEDAPTVINDAKTRPQIQTGTNGSTVTLPEFHSMVRALDQVIDVDYYLPGCPPTPKLLKQAIEALLTGKLPEKGSVLAPDIALCDECKRIGTKPADFSFSEFKRPHLTEIDPEKCLLSQGLLCLGSATRGGCEAQCINGNMPCTGCFGPTSHVKDHGAKILSALASHVDAKNEGDIDAILTTIPDPVGTFYRYGLASSLLRRKVG
jgi:F420-non-reducing hydrogenase small subunit